VLRIASALAVLAVLGLAPSAGAGSTDFRTPSGLIYCGYTTGPTFLRCDTRYQTRFSGTRECEHGDFGQGFGMTRTGRGRALCISDSVYDRNAKVLRYGTTRSFGPFKCTSRRSGLTCRNPRGHGWILSRQTQKLF
jgi:hypothetical protein